MTRASPDATVSPRWFVHKRLSFTRLLASSFSVTSAVAVMVSPKNVGARKRVVISRAIVPNPGNLVPEQGL